MHAAVRERAVATVDTAGLRQARTVGASLSYPELVDRVLAALDTLRDAASTA